MTASSFDLVWPSRASVIFRSLAWIYVSMKSCDLKLIWLNMIFDWTQCTICIAVVNVFLVHTLLTWAILLRTNVLVMQPLICVPSLLYHPFMMNTESNIKEIIYNMRIVSLIPLLIFLLLGNSPIGTPQSIAPDRFLILTWRIVVTLCTISSTSKQIQWYTASFVRLTIHYCATRVESDFLMNYIWFSSV